MADLYSPAIWVDGMLVNAGNGPNRWEAGIESLDIAVDAHGDRLDAIEAALSNLSASRVETYSTANRPPPTAGRLIFDTTLRQYLGGDGTSWKALSGETEPEGPGTSGAPTGMQAVVQQDNSIDLSWNPVAGADFYTLYEIRSPEGVNGATELTTTSSTRSPSSMGPYEYWVTATVDGIESAQSNHALCSLPYGSEPGEPPPGGGNTGGTPAEVLNLGGSGGDWNLGVGYPSGHRDIEPGDLYDGWSEAPYFYVTESGDAVHFQVPMNGGTTSSNTKYPRSELREYIGSSKAAWNGGSGTHVMSYEARVLHMAPDKQEMVIGQMHDGSDDTLQIRAEGTTWRASINGEEHSTSLGTFSTGTWVRVEIRLDDGELQIRINGSTRITTDPGYGSGQYFKLGCYAQQNSTDQDNDDDDFASCEVRNLVVSHS